MGLIGLENYKRDWKLDTISKTEIISTVYLSIFNMDV